MIVEAPWTGLPPASASFQAARTMPSGSIAPCLKKFLSSIATVASFSVCGSASEETGWRMLSERMKPIRLPSAA